MLPFGDVPGCEWLPWGRNLGFSAHPFLDLHPCGIGNLDAVGFKAVQDSLVEPRHCIEETTNVGVAGLKEKHKVEAVVRDAREAADTQTQEVIAFDDIGNEGGDTFNNCQGRAREIPMLR